MMAPDTVGDDNDARFYIDGRWQARADAARIAVVNPFSEEVAGHVAAGSSADVDLAVAAARRAFSPFSRSTVGERMALLGRILALLEERAEQFAQAIMTEMGAPIGFARTSHVPFAIAHVRTQMEVLQRYEFLSVAGGLAISREPIGVCALITPWNWPLYQITAKIAPAIAAGCTIVLKPSELSPFSARLFAQVMHDAGTPAGVFNLVGGTGEVVGAALAAHPDVDMISITGSTRAGVLVAQAGAVSVKRVVQELGGKSPNLFLDDADFGQGVAKGVLAGMRNAGQSCSAPTRMLVPASRLAEVESLAAKAVSGIVVGDPRDEKTSMGPIANAAQYARVQSMIASGVEEGARPICGGPGRPDGLTHGYFARPTVFSDVTPGMRVAREEIFGPVLVLMPYRDEAQAIAIANDQGCAARGLETEGGRVCAVVTESGTIRTRVAVLAGGAWASSFCRQYGIRFPQAAIRQTALSVATAGKDIPAALHTTGVSMTRRADGGYTLAISGRGRVDPTPQLLRFAPQFLPMMRSGNPPHWVGRIVRPTGASLSRSAWALRRKPTATRSPRRCARAASTRKTARSDECDLYKGSNEL